MKKLIFMIVFMLLLLNIFGHPKVSLGQTSHHYRGDMLRSRIDSLHGFDVLNYYIELEIDDENEFISGWVEADLIAQNNLNTIEYNLVDLDVSMVLVDGIESDYTYENGLISIPVNVENNQQITTKVFYSGNPQLSTDGYNIGMIFRPNMVFTISDPYASRNWFPSYDYPWDKAIISFNITCRDDWVAACNGIQGTEMDNGDGTKSYEWIGENPMATYLAVIHIAPYQLIEQSFTKENGQVIPIQHFVQNNYYQDCLVDFAQVPDMMQAFTDAYGEYPFEKYGQALVNMQTYGAMEHQTMTTLGVTYIDGQPDDAEHTIAHELSHHWFGNCLTPFTWKDIWLSEGFATYSEAIWENYLFGYESMLDYVNTNIKDYYVNWQSYSGAQTIYNPDYLDYFTPPSYEKAASVLHMLRLELGEEIFWNTIQTWFAGNQYSNVITSEFQEHCQTISGLDLEQFFSQWIYSPGIPSYEYALFRNQNTNEIKFYNNVTSESGTDFYLTIPFYVGASTDSLRTNFTPGYSMTEAITVDTELNLSVDPREWNLVKNSSQLVIQLENVYGGDQEAILTWTPFPNEDNFLGYNIYRKRITEEDWLQVNDQPVNGNSFVDSGLINGETYHYYVVIEDELGFETYPTNSLDLTVTPQAIDPTNTILIVDDSADGSGAILVPTDEEIDSFYANIFAGYNVDTIDLNLEELLEEDIADYQAIIWHNDTVQSSSIAQYESMLGNYLLSGGKLIISGWKTIIDLSPNFASLFFGIEDFEMYNSPSLSFAESQDNLYPDLVVNSQLLPDSFSGQLSYVAGLSLNADNSIYWSSEINQSIACKNPPQTQWQSYFFAFPLYYFQENQVRTMLLSLLSNTNPPVANHEDVVPAEITLYPNPVNNVLHIQSSNKSNSEIELTIFNIRGQKVADYPVLKTKNGKASFNLSEIKLANGIYFVKISNNDNQQIRKIVLLKK